MNTLYTYLPQDRRRALMNNQALPVRSCGSVLLADISGFVPLTEELTALLGARGGAEQLMRVLNDLYTALITVVERYGGSVVNFAGDAILCWFEESVGGECQQVQHAPRRAVSCALELQQAMLPFVSLAFPGGDAIPLALKVSIASGEVQRLLVGDPAIQLLDVLVGSVVESLSLAQEQVQPGEVLADALTRQVLGGDLQVGTASGEAGEFFPVLALHPPAEPCQAGSSPPGKGLDREWMRPYILPAVYERECQGQGAFLTEFRPAVAGFLSFSGIDYEQVGGSVLLDAFIQRTQATLKKYEGVLLDLTLGDKGAYLYFVFGAPVAHEDDVQRAVTAAVEIQRTERRIGALDSVRVGLSLGTMRAGSYGSPTRRVYGVLGDEVNLSARLMEYAQPGQILASGWVRREAGEVFQWEPLVQLQVKGRQEAITVWLLLSEARPVEHWYETFRQQPMVGRQAELKRILERLEQAKQGQGQMVGIVADAGMGKSRLAADAFHLAEAAGAQVYPGACQSFGMNTAYLVWRGPWRKFFGLDASLTVETQVAQLRQAVEQLDPALTSRVPLLGILLGLPVPENPLTQSLDAQLRKSSMEDLLVDCLKRRCREDCVVVFLLEDLHWIDPLSRDLFEKLARAIAVLPVLLLAVYRPRQQGYFQSPCLEDQPNCILIDLPELTTSEAQQLIAHRLSRRALQVGEANDRIFAPLYTRIIEKAQGNPFYIEELLNYLQDQGVMSSVAHHGAAQVHRHPGSLAALQTLSLPDSLHRLVLSRIDQLTEQQAITLKVASVLGRFFRVRWLEGYYPELGGPAQVMADLENLSRLDIIRQVSPEPDLAYVFKHVITQEVAYESLPYTVRSRLHSRLAEYLEGRSDPEKHLDLLAYHYERGDCPQKKREYLLRAGDAAYKAYAAQAALNYYERLLPGLDEAEARGQVHLKLSAVLELLGRWGEAETQTQKAWALAQDAGNPDMQAQCQRSSGALARQRGDYPTALERFEQAMETWKSLGNSTRVGQVLTEIGGVYIRKGDYPAAQRHLKESLALARQQGDPVGTALALNNLGNATLEQGNYAEARLYYEESLALRRQADHKRGIAATLNNLALLAKYQGDYAAARELHASSLALKREMGDKRGTVFSLNNLGFVLIEQGEIDRAGALHTEGLALAREMGDRRGTALALNGLGSVAQRSGDLEAARMHLEESLALYREMGDRQGIAASLGSLGNLACQRQDAAAALALHTESLEIKRQIGDRRGIANSLADLGLVALQQCDWSRAEAHYRQGLEQAWEIGDRFQQVGCLLGLAAAVVQAGQEDSLPDIETARRAVRLVAAALALSERIGAAHDALEEKYTAATQLKVRRLLGQQAYSAAWDAGLALDIEQVLQEARYSGSVK